MMAQQNVKIDEPAHAPFPPSSAATYMKCNAWKQLTDNLVDPGNKYADEGTDAHTLAEMCKFDKSPHEFIGHKLPKGYIVTDEMADAIEQYLTDAAYYAGFNDTGSNVEVAFEQKLVFNADLWGTSDLVVYNKEEQLIQVHDLKYGKGRVNAEGNPQLLAYAFMALLTIADDNVNRVQVYIHQPRINHTDWHEYTREEVETFKRELINAIAENKKPDAYTKATPGKSQCKWCLARGNCYALAKHVGDVVRDVDSGDIKATTGLSNEQLGKIRDELPLIENFCKAIAAEVHTRIIDKGESVPGAKAVMGREGNRAWIDKKAAIARAKSTWRLKDDDIYKKELKSVAQIEKLVSKKQFATVADELVFRKPARPVIVDESDKREAIVFQSEHDAMLDSVDQTPSEFVTELVADSLVKEVSGKSDSVSKAVMRAVNKTSEHDAMLDSVDQLDSLEQPEKEVKPKTEETVLDLDSLF